MTIPTNENTLPATEKSQTSALKDVYARVTSQILSDMQQGQLTWRKPWNSEHLAGNVMRPLRWNNVPYQGINTLLLWSAAAEKGYLSPYWMTFNQALELKANVIKGEKGTQIVYADTFLKEEENQDGETIANRIPFLKTYTVFNASQIEGLPASYAPAANSAQKNCPERITRIEEFFAQTGADIYTGTKAAYSVTTDRVQMPPMESFEDVRSYYAVLAHEITHWTKHPIRLNRDFGRKQFGDAGYAKEELVAELGACFLAADLGIEPKPEQNHAAYLQVWLKALQDDKRLIFQAASHAQKAVDYLNTLQLCI